MSFNESPLRKRLYAFYVVLSCYALLSGLSSCKKSNGSNDSGGNAPHASFKVDGNQQNFAASTFAEVTNENAPGSSEYTMVISFIKSINSPTVSTLSIVLAGTTPFVTGHDYTAAYVPGTYESGATLTYFNEVGILYASFNVLQPSLTQVTVRLTSLSATKVAGSFSGKVFDQDQTSLSSMITDGSFTAKFSN